LQGAHQQNKVDKKKIVILSALTVSWVSIGECGAAAIRLRSPADRKI
jgi:hypothetical protein